jgi:hypothetical protein
MIIGDDVSVKANLRQTECRGENFKITAHFLRSINFLYAIPSSLRLMCIILLSTLSLAHVSFSFYCSSPFGVNESHFLSMPLVAEANSFVQTEKIAVRACSFVLGDGISSVMGKSHFDSCCYSTFSRSNIVSDPQTTPRSYISRESIFFMQASRIILTHIHRLTQSSRIYKHLTTMSDSKCCSCRFYQ